MCVFESWCIFPFFFSLFSANFRNPMFSLVNPINANWNEFLEECSRHNLTENTEKFWRCSNKYLDKTVLNWEGYVIRVEDNRNSLYKYVSHAVTIMVKMVPSESEMIPDLMLSFDSY